MRKPMVAAESLDNDNDWSDFAMKGDTQPSMKCAVPVEVVDDSPSEEDAETLRMIATVLESVESERPSGPDIETCTSSERRGDIPTTNISEDEW